MATTPFLHDQTTWTYDQTSWTWDMTEITSGAPAFPPTGYFSDVYVASDGGVHRRKKRKRLEMLLLLLE